MTLLDICNARYSCRQYAAQPVPQEKMEYVRECARMAPSAVNRQPWRFVVVDTPEGLAALWPAYGREWIRTAPAIIVCLADEAGAWVRPADGKCHADIDVAIAIEHICLAATEQGLGTCWVCNFDPQVVRAAIDIPEGYAPAALLPIGYPADTAKAKSRKAAEEMWG